MAKRLLRLLDKRLIAARSPLVYVQRLPHLLTAFHGAQQGFVEVVGSGSGHSDVRGFGVCTNIAINCDGSCLASNCVEII